FVATFVGRANVLRGPAARVLGASDGQVAVVRPERLRFADRGLAALVKDRRYTGAAAFYEVETEHGARLEVLAAPDAARVGGGARHAARVPVRVARVPRTQGARLAHRAARRAAAVRRRDRVSLPVRRVGLRRAGRAGAVRVAAAAVAAPGRRGDPARPRLFDV